MGWEIWEREKWEIKNYRNKTINDDDDNRLMYKNISIY